MSIDTIDLLQKLDLTAEMRKELQEVRVALEKEGVTAARVVKEYHVKIAGNSRTAANWLFLTLGLERKYMNREKYPEILWRNGCCRLLPHEKQDEP